MDKLSLVCLQNQDRTTTVNGSQFFGEGFFCCNFLFYWAKPGKESSMKDKNKLAVIDGETLMDMRLVPNKFCVTHCFLKESVFSAVHRRSENRGSCSTCAFASQRESRSGICKHTKERCCISALKIRYAVCKNG